MTAPTPYPPFSRAWHSCAYSAAAKNITEPSSHLQEHSRDLRNDQPSTTEPPPPAAAAVRAAGVVTVAVAKVAAARVAVKAPTGPCTPKIGVGLIPDDALEHIFTRAVCDDHPEGRLLRTTFRGGYRYKEVNAFKGVCVGWRARRVARFTKYVHTRVCLVHRSHGSGPCQQASSRSLWPFLDGHHLHSVLPAALLRRYSQGLRARN